MKIFKSFSDLAQRDLVAAAFKAPVDSGPCPETQVIRSHLAIVDIPFIVYKLLKYLNHTILVFEVKL